MKVGKHRVRASCGLCRRGPLATVLDLGMTPLANEYPSLGDLRAMRDVNETQEVFPLALVRCEACRHVQTSVVVDSRRLFGNYLYETGTSPVTVDHFRSYAAEVTERFGILKKPGGGSVVEIGSNDGTMLKAFQDLGVGSVLGIDPAENIAAKASGKTIVGFFSKKMAAEIVAARGNADLVVANNVLAHAEDIYDVLEGVQVLLGRDGIFVFEVSYLMDMFEHLAFDTVYHEHFSYHSLGPVTAVLDDLHLRVIDVQRTPAQMGRGSIRVFVAPYTAGSQVGGIIKLLGPKFIETARALAVEESQVHTSMLPWKFLKRTIASEGSLLRSTLLRFKDEGKSVCGYGAPAKMTTLTYAMNLPRVDYVIEDAPLKVDRFTPGQHVPIVGPKNITRWAPDVCVLFAWNFADAIIEKWKSGGVTGHDGKPLPIPIFIHPLSSIWS